MSEYCTATDLQNRLTANGIKYGADRNRDGQVSAAEVTAFVTSSIQIAGSTLDDMLEVSLGHTAVAAGRGQAGTNCLWLRDMAVALAAYHFVTIGGRDCPESIQKAHDYAIEQIDRKKYQNERIPGLVYQPPEMPHAIGHSARRAVAHNYT